MIFWVVLLVVVLAVLAGVLLRPPREVGESILGDGRFVGRDQVGRFLVSTVDLRCDYPGGRYETMVFEYGKQARDLAVRRYPTREDAAVGHKDMIALVREIEGIRG